jgi:hypothetical protein
MANQSTKCARCGKPSPHLTQLLWMRGPNGFRKYMICDTCKPLVENDNNSKKPPAEPKGVVK